MAWFGYIVLGLICVMGMWCFFFGIPLALAVFAFRRARDKHESPVALTLCTLLTLVPGCLLLAQLRWETSSGEIMFFLPVIAITVLAAEAGVRLGLRFAKGAR